MGFQSPGQYGRVGALVFADALVLCIAHADHAGARRAAVGVADGGLASSCARVHSGAYLRPVAPPLRRVKLCVVPEFGACAWQVPACIINIKLAQCQVPGARLARVRIARVAGWPF